MGKVDTLLAGGVNEINILFEDGKDEKYPIFSLHHVYMGTCLLMEIFIE